MLKSKHLSNITEICGFILIFAFFLLYWTNYVYAWETLSAGYTHTCGIISDKSIDCWGIGNSWEAVDQSGTFLQVSTLNAHTCWLRTDGTVKCWGDNTYWQSTDQTGTFLQISAWDYHTCGVRTDHTLACWGKNFWWASSPPFGFFKQVSTGHDQI